MDKISHVQPYVCVLAIAHLLIFVPLQEGVAKVPLQEGVAKRLVAH